MANLFVDFTGGNDANNATSFALRAKTITSGITAARTAPGDVIRLMKSENPVSLGVNATFTNLSDTVTLASSVTQNIYNTGTWTASANVTYSSSTTRKEGTDCASLAIAAAFTTGLVAYYPTGTIALSAYTKFTFWIRANGGVGTGVLSLKLCGDALGVTAAHTCVINNALTANAWTCVIFDNAGVGLSAIQSISLNAISDPGTVTVLIDNVIAGSTLTGTSIIGLSSSATSLDFYPIKSINGTAIKLDGGPSTDSSTTVRGYTGTTTTATCYKIEPFRPTNFYSIVQEAGTDTFTRSTYSGGWDTTDMSTQTGVTWLDTGNGDGSTLATSFAFINFEYIGTVRGSTGHNGNASNLKYTNCASIGAAGNGFLSPSIANYNSFDGCVSRCNNTAGFTVNGIGTKIKNSTASGNTVNGINVTAHNFLATTVTTSNNSGSGVNLAGNDITLYSVTSRSNQISGVSATSLTGATVRAYDVNTSLNSTSGVGALAGAYITVTGATCTDTTPFTSTNETAILQVNNLAGDANVSRYYHRNGTTITGQLEATTLHAPATKNWKFIPQNNHTVDFPQIFKLDRIPVAATGVLTFSVWVQRSATTASAMLVLRGGQVTNVASDLTATASAAINTWEILTITCSPTQATAIEFELHTWRNTSTGGNVFFSDFTAKQV